MFLFKDASIIGVIFKRENTSHRGKIFATIKIRKDYCPEYTKNSNKSLRKQENPNRKMYKRHEYD